MSSKEAHLEDNFNMKSVILSILLQKTSIISHTTAINRLPYLKDLCTLTPPENEVAVAVDEP
jgi:hypothetical protein